MSLLNGILAFGAAAFVIPLVIHLLHRSRLQTVPWGAMYLLAPIVHNNRRRLKWTNLILLLIRCAIPIVLAFCLARPVLTWFQVSSSDGPQSIVLVIDDSLSMTTTDASNVSRIRRLRQSLGNLFTSESRRDEVIWMPTNNLDDPPATISPALAIEKADEMQTIRGPFSLANVIRRAVAVAKDGSYPYRRIIIASDFQNVNLDHSSIESVRSFVENSKTEDSPSLSFPRIQLWNLSANDPDPKNVWIESIDTQSPVVVPERQTELTATIRSSADQELSELKLIWSINGERLDSAPVSVPANGKATSRIPYRFPEPGGYEISVQIDSASIESADHLRADNTRSSLLQVIEQIKVWLVDGDPSERPLESETDFLRIALSPFTFAQSDEVDAIITTTVSADRIEDELGKNRPDVLVLANVLDLSVVAQNKIAEFVQSGGSLILFDGANLSDANYRSGFQHGDVTMPLPASIKELAGVVPEKQKPTSAAAPLRVESGELRYAAWQGLSRGDRNPLRDVDIYAYRKLRLSSDVDSTVLLSMQNGDPIVVAATRGAGSIVQFAIPADTGWTNLPLRPVFVPLMQQLVVDLVTSIDKWQNGAGQPPALESQLQAANSETIRSITDLIGATIHDDVDSINTIQTEEQFGRELWKSLLAILLVLMVTELVYQQWSTGVQAR
ncbi:hypothetical protein Q31b_07580 [Novipirellula aureliae]|uniref:Aerotolerance regulator N-terminal domain-containing protein n=1 Tax=Novipirellula aureliae TaxID=2527966 RepID=A0A5C6E7G3_9BACT|nr:BatA domain-containing protein [Novipirellula aureliae]TWU45583.1 hypothetical protein Q31b_07580 [Novipirellula aureliae]